MEAVATDLQDKYDELYEKANGLITDWKGNAPLYFMNVALQCENKTILIHDKMSATKSTVSDH